MKYEFIGITATIFVLLSFLVNDIKKVRIINIVGAALFVIYGVLIGAFSTYLLNGLLIAIHLYYLLRKTKDCEGSTLEKANDKSVVLLSGGIDSTTCLAMALAEKGEENVVVLNMIYGQKHDKELKSARAVADYYGVPYFEMDLSNVMKHSDCSLLKHSTKVIKHQSYGDQMKENGIVDTYVPFRNGLFLSAAAAFAVSIGAGHIFYGAHADDAAGSAYPDCSQDFVQAMGNAIYEGSGRNVILHAPLIDMNKSDVVKLGLKYNAPYHLTWSCYEGKEKACGTCGTCIDRLKAFEANGIRDPIEYV